jgi:hypothetical protein
VCQQYDHSAEPFECDETLANVWHKEAYRAGQGAAAQGTTLPDAIRKAEMTGAPFGDEGRKALTEGWWNRVRFERDMRDENDKPRAA